MGQNVRNVCLSVIKYVCFCFFCVLLAFPLSLLFDASVFCFLPIFVMKARWVTIWLRLVFYAICFSYVNKHTYLVFASSNFWIDFTLFITALLPKVIDWFFVIDWMCPWNSLISIISHLFIADKLMNGQLTLVWLRQTVGWNQRKWA